MNLRISELEAKAIGALCIGIGIVSTNTLRMFKGISKQRALEIEKLFPSLNSEEITFIRSFLKDAT